MTKEDIKRCRWTPSTIVSAFASGRSTRPASGTRSIDTIEKQVPDLVELAKNQDFADTCLPHRVRRRQRSRRQDERREGRRQGAARRDRVPRRAHRRGDRSSTAEMLDGRRGQVKADAGNIQMLDVDGAGRLDRGRHASTRGSRA